MKNLKIKNHIEREIKNKYDVIYLIYCLKSAKKKISEQFCSDKNKNRFRLKQKQEKPVCVFYHFFLFPRKKKPFQKKEKMGFLLAAFNWPIYGFGGVLLWYGMEGLSLKKYLSDPAVYQQHEEAPYLPKPGEHERTKY